MMKLQWILLQLVQTCALVCSQFRERADLTLKVSLFLCVFGFDNLNKSNSTFLYFQQWPETLSQVDTKNILRLYLRE